VLDKTYICFLRNDGESEPFACVDLTDGELRLLVQALKDEFDLEAQRLNMYNEKIVECVRESEWLQKHPVSLLRLRAEWRRREADYATLDRLQQQGEISEQRPSDDYLAYRLTCSFVRELKDLREAEPNRESGGQEPVFPIGVYDVEAKRSVFFDGTGCQHWGPRFSGSGGFTLDGVPEWNLTEDLYRHPDSHWTLLVDKQHCEAEFSSGTDAQRLSDDQAARWLLSNKFELPNDLQHFRDEWSFKPAPPSKVDEALSNEASQPLVDEWGPPAAFAETSATKGAGRLSESEQRIMTTIEAIGHRVTTEELLEHLEKHHGATSTGTTKQTLAGLVRRGLLNNRQDVRPKGYGLSLWGK
jgi:Penicillinase repressor